MIAIRMLTKCQTATATRDLSELTERKILIRLGSSPKTTIYVLNPNLETILKSAPDNV